MTVCSKTVKTFFYRFMVIGVTNLKGGVGKTTITQNLAVAYALDGRKVCIIDADKNQNSMEWSGARPDDVAKVIVMGCTEPKALSRLVETQDEIYDLVLIDGTPDLGEMTTRVMLASDILLIPILPSGHDFRSMVLLLNRFEQAKVFKPDFPAYFILNRFDSRINFHGDMGQLLEQYEIPILETKMKSRVSYAQTGVSGTGVVEFSDKKAAEEIKNLAAEVISKLKK